MKEIIIIHEQKDRERERERERDRRGELKLTVELVCNNSSSELARECSFHTFSDT